MISLHIISRTFAWIRLGKLIQPIQGGVVDSLSDI